MSSFFPVNLWQSKSYFNQPAGGKQNLMSVWNKRVTYCSLIVYNRTHNIHTVVHRGVYCLPVLLAIASFTRLKPPSFIAYFTRDIKRHLTIVWFLSDGLCCPTVCQGSKRPLYILGRISFHSGMSPAWTPEILP